MKTLKIFMVVLIAVAFIVPLSVNESQAAGWYTCWINKIGQEPSATSYILLTEASSPPAFTGKWFQLDPTSKTVFQAIAMTSMASGLKVYAYLSGTTGGMCTALYLVDQ